MKISSLMAGALVGLAFLLPAQAPKEPKKNLAALLPAGEGKDILQAGCVQCHGLGEVFSHRLDAKAWDGVVSQHLAGRGVQLLPGEPAILVQYLAANFGPLLDVNQATAAELAQLPSVDKKLAEAIVRFRKTNGPFQMPQGLTRVVGVSPEILDKIKDRITTGSQQDKEKDKRKEGVR